MNEKEPSSEKFIDVTCAIIIKENKVLIARRASGQSLEGQWEFPGGKIEQGETAEDCLARELREELGIIVQVGKLIFKYEHNYNRLNGKRHRFFAFNCVLLEGDLKRTVHDKLAWVAIEKLPNFDFVEADIQLVEALMGSKSSPTES